MSNCFAVLTALGQAMVAESIRVNTPINLAEVAVGDFDYTPNEGQTALMHERARVKITEILADQDNPSWLRIMATLPPDIGGWHIHEAGVFAENGSLFAVAKMDGSYKPVYSDGMVKEIALDFILEVSSEANVNLIIDPNVITVTRQWVIDFFNPKFANLKDLMEKHIKDKNNPHAVTVEQLGVYTSKEVDALLMAMMPPGTLIHQAHGQVPTGFLECNGAAISRAAYAALFGKLGGSYGVGNGSTTFNLPDYRGEFLRGWDHGRGIDPGRALGSWQQDAIRNITGTLYASVHIRGAGVFGNSGDYRQGAAFGVQQGVVDMDISRQVPTAHENRSRNVSAMICIKY